SIEQNKGKRSGEMGSEGSEGSARKRVRKDGGKRETKTPEVVKDPVKEDPGLRSGSEEGEMVEDD
ncbi:MAG: hypothetical protein Q9194_007774, partial [Teloschistes cf. exilis]